MNKSLEPLILLKRWQHHTKSGGYDSLGRYLVGEKIYTKKSTLKRSSLRYKLWRHVVPSSKYINHYTFVDLLTELKVIARLTTGKIDVVHALYAEDQLNFLLKFKRKLNCALVGSFHLPFESEYVKRAVQSGHYKDLKKLDAAIVVSRTMIPDFENWVGKGKVHFVPHGIDTEVFTPRENEISQPDSNLNILFIGGHIRDSDILQKVIEHHQEIKSSVQFTAVVRKSDADKLSSYKNVQVVSMIPETELIELYRRSHVLFMPVINATANNAILESMACGTPVISTNVGGVPDYIDDRCGWLFDRGNVNGILDLLESMQQNSAIYLSKKEPARTQALKFGWKHIAKEVTVVYEKAFEK